MTTIRLKIAPFTDENTKRRANGLPALTELYTGTGTTYQDAWDHAISAAFDRWGTTSDANGIEPNFEIVSHSTVNE